MQRLHVQESSVKKADTDGTYKTWMKEGLLFACSEIMSTAIHYCWRCDTPLIYYARESWFIKMTAVKDDLIRNNNTINWIPESIGKGRFGDWLENVQDWGISQKPLLGNTAEYLGVRMRSSCILSEASPGTF